MSEKKYKPYSKQKRRTNKQTRRIKKRLLYLVNKLRRQIDALIRAAKALNNNVIDYQKTPLTARFFERLGLIKRVYDKQKNHYLRPDVGKEQSTELEGSFENEKNHYGLVKSKLEINLLKRFGFSFVL